MAGPTAKVPKINIRYIDRGSSTVPRKPSTLLAELTQEADRALDILLIKDVGTRDEILRLIDAVINDDIHKKSKPTGTQRTTIAACSIYLIAKKRAFAISIRELCRSLDLNIRGFSEYLVRIKSQHYSLVHHGASVWKNLSKIIKRMNFTSGDETEYITKTIKSLIRICRYRDARFEYEAAHVTTVLAFFAWQSYDPFGIIQLEKSRFKPRQFVEFNEFSDYFKIAKGNMFNKQMHKVHNILCKLADEFDPNTIAKESLIIKLQSIIRFGLNLIPANSEHDIEDIIANHPDDLEEDGSYFLDNSNRRHTMNGTGNSSTMQIDRNGDINSTTDRVNDDNIYQATTSKFDQSISNNATDTNVIQRTASNYNQRSPRKQILIPTNNYARGKSQPSETLSNGICEPWTAEEIFANIPKDERRCYTYQDDYEDIDFQLLTESFDFTKSPSYQINDDDSNRRRELSSYKISISPEEERSKESAENFSMTLKKTITVIEFEDSETKLERADSDAPSPLIRDDEIAGEPEVLEMDCD